MRTFCRLLDGARAGFASAARSNLVLVAAAVQRSAIALRKIRIR